MNTKEHREADEKNNTVELEEVSGLGALLKEGREKKGLSYEEMAQITKLRSHALEALENEEWHHLPPSVFVKGFIKACAKALDLEENKLLDLYHKSIHQDAASPSQVISPPKRTKKGIIFVLIGLFGALSVSLYFWMGKPSSESATDQTRKESSSKMLQGIEEKAETVPLESEPEDPVKEPEVASVPEGLLRPELEPRQTNSPEPLQLEEEPGESASDEDLLMASAAVSPAAAELFVLTGRVRSETYVKIYVDDQTPKEYMFRPGSRPRWEAKEGFYVMLGNAAGIEFDLNGKEYRDLGKEGDVVRFRLPESFERQIFEE